MSMRKDAALRKALAALRRRRKSIEKALAHYQQDERGIHAVKAIETREEEEERKEA